MIFPQKCQNPEMPQGSHYTENCGEGNLIFCEGFSIKHLLSEENEFSNAVSMGRGLFYTILAAL